MDSVILFSILILLAVVVILMLMVVDHVRAVHQAVAPPLPVAELNSLNALALPHSEQAPAAGGNLEDHPVNEQAEAHADEQALQEDRVDMTFGNLQGKRLWDGMTGKPVEGVEPEKIQELRPRYGVILTKHVTELVAEGAEHAASGGPKPASNRRKIKGLRGVVSSWIPQQHADAVYQAGFDSATVTEKNLDSVRKSLSETLEVLFKRTEVDANATDWAKRLIHLPGQGGEPEAPPALGMEGAPAEALSEGGSPVPQRAEAQPA